MGKYVIDETTLTAIGDSIREKEGTTEAVPVTEMAGRIAAITTAEDKMTLTAVGNTVQTEIERYAYSEATALKYVDFPNVTTVGGYAFKAATALETVNLPEFTTAIGAFDGCSALKSVNLPKIKSVGQYLFRGCSSLSGDLGDIIPIQNLEYISNGGFEKCTSLKTVNLQDTSQVKGSSFYGCTALESAEFAKVTDVPAKVFRGCTVLKTVKLPVAEFIGFQAFRDCVSLQYVDFSGCSAVPTLEDVDAFQNVPASCSIKVPSALLSAWKTADNWSTYANQIVGV